MAEGDELELLRQLSQARSAGDVRAELEALRSLKQVQGAQPEPVEPMAFGRRAGARFASNVTSIPSAIGKLLEISAAGAQTGAGELAESVGLGQDVPIGQRFSEAREQNRQQQPAAFLQSFPSASPEQVLAASEMARSPVQSAQAGIGQEFGRQVEQQEQIAAQHPTRTGAEDVLGDVMTVLTGRPAMRPAFRAARAVPRSQRQAVDILDSAANRLSRVTGFSKRLGAQAGEAGLEGALLAAMGDGDPLATAGWAAGTQVGGGLALQGTRAFARYPWRSLGGLALGHWIYRALAPGGQGALEDVRDETVQTMLTTFGLGTLAAMTGAGRLAPGRTGGRDRFIDAFDTIRRAPLPSIIRQFQEAEESGDNRLGIIVGKIAEDPGYFGQEARQRLERASRSDKANALANEIDSLMNSSRFRQRFDELTGVQE